MQKSNIEKNTGFRYGLSVIISILTAVIILIIGYILINNETTIAGKKSSFELTDFDYVIVSPSKEQITTFDANTNAVNKIFPCYNFNIVANGKNMSTINVLLSDDMQDYNIGLLCDNTIIQGQYNENGIMIDQKTADKLNVTVGDNISFTLGSQSITLPVSAICLTSTYRNLDSGLALATWKSVYDSYFTKTLAYNLAFIDANDVSLCQAMLTGYIPMGQLMSQEDYIQEYKSTHTLPPNTTESEWNDAIITAYNTYKTNFLSQTYNGVVQDKSYFLTDANDQVETLAKENQTIFIVTIIFSFILYATIQSILVYRNKKSDESRFKEALVLADALKKSDYISSILNPVFTSIAIGLGLFIITLLQPFTGIYNSIIFGLSLTILATVIVIFFSTYWYHNHSLIVKQTRNTKKSGE